MRVALEFFSRRVFCSGQALRVGSIRHPLPDPPGAAGKRPRICYRGGISDPLPPWGPRPTSILPLPRSRFPSGWLFFSRPWGSVLPGERDPPPSAQEPRAHETHRSIASRHHGGSCCTSQTPAEQVRDRLLQTGAGSDHGHGHVRNLPRRKNQSGRQSRCVLRHTPPSSKKKART